MNVANEVSSIRQHEEQLDFKITKRHYPRLNNKTILLFIFDKDTNLFRRKNKIVIRTGRGGSKSLGKKFVKAE